MPTPEKQQLQELMQAMPESISLLDLIDRVNEHNSNLKDDELLISKLDFKDKFELSPEWCVYISIDEVGVKQQEFERKLSTLYESIRAVQRRKERADANSKFKEQHLSVWNKGVHTTVAYIQWDNHFMELCAPSMNDMMLELKAALIENGLMGTRRLVFFADGAKNISKAICEHFSFVNKQLILDWFHISQAIKQLVLLSRVLKTRRSYLVKLSRLTYGFMTSKVLYNIYRGLMKLVKSEIVLS